MDPFWGQQFTRKRAKSFSGFPRQGPKRFPRPLSTFSSRQNRVLECMPLSLVSQGGPQGEQAPQIKAKMVPQIAEFLQSPTCKPCSLGSQTGLQKVGRKRCWGRILSGPLIGRQQFSSYCYKTSWRVPIAPSKKCGTLQPQASDTFKIWPANQYL